MFSPARAGSSHAQAAAQLHLADSQPLPASQSSSSSSSAAVPPGAQQMQDVQPGPAPTPVRARSALAIAPVGAWEHVHVTMGQGRLRQLMQCGAGRLTAEEALSILPAQDGKAPVNGLFDSLLGRRLALILTSSQAVALGVSAARGRALEQFIASSLEQFSAHTGAPPTAAYGGISEGADFDSETVSLLQAGRATEAQVASVMQNPLQTPLATLRALHREEVATVLGRSGVELLPLPRGAVYIDRDGTVDTFPEAGVGWHKPDSDCEHGATEAAASPQALADPGQALATEAEAQPDEEVDVAAEDAIRAPSPAEAGSARTPVMDTFVDPPARALATGSRASLKRPREF